MPTDEYLTAKEAAKFLRTSVSQLYENVRSGKIPASKPSGRLLFHRASLQAHIESCRAIPQESQTPVYATPKKRSKRKAGEIYHVGDKWVG